MFLLYLIASDQSLRAQADMAAGAHHDMVVHGDAEPLARLRDRPRDVDIRAAGGGVAARVVVDEDDRRGTEVDRAPDDFADVHCGLVDRPLAHHLVANQHVLGVEV